MADALDLYADILARLPQPQRRHKTGYSFRCPFGDRHKSGFDRNPSATAWAGGNGQLLVGCFGCNASFDEWVEYTGVPAHQWFPDRAKYAGLTAQAAARVPTKVASYEYRDRDGKWVGTKTKWVPGLNGRSKSFIWTWADGVAADQCPLYLLPELVRADRDDPVFVVEGESCVHSLTRLGFTATCSPHGSNQWLPVHTDTLAGRWCVVMPDNDRVGGEFAALVSGSVLGAADRVSVARPGRDGYTPPDGGGDVKDWLKGLSRADAAAAVAVLVNALPAYRRERAFWA